MLSLWLFWSLRRCLLLDDHDRHLLGVRSCCARPINGRSECPLAHVRDDLHVLWRIVPTIREDSCRLVLVLVDLVSALLLGCDDAQQFQEHHHWRLSCFLRREDATNNHCTRLLWHGRSHHGLPWCMPRPPCCMHFLLCDVRRGRPHLCPPFVSLSSSVKPAWLAHWSGNHMTCCGITEIPTHVLVPHRPANIMERHPYTFKFA
mmetsp:Transcript_20013/g.60815  ORF Transcript_20013/g.60815 Transcript_20013/m.60815 type:complete len:204 (+) Transcript_20013:1494-2105(+)